jgi:dihydrofolate reductase
MRKIVQYTLTSLDGAVDDPRRYFPDSSLTAASPPVFDALMADLESRLIAEQDAVLLGRTTFDEWAGYWPDSAEQPFADFINGVRKYVATSTPLTTEWTNSERIDGPVVDVVRRLKAGTGGAIGIHGSISLARSLLAEGLVDELQLAIGPVLDPMGRRLFDGLGTLRRLELASAVRTPSGTLWVTYRLH